MTRHVLAIIIRSRVAAIAVFIGEEVLEVRRRHFNRCPRGQSQFDYLAKVVRQLVVQYQPAAAVVEPGSLAELVALAHGLLCRRVPLAEAKARLVGERTTHARLYGHVVERFPRLKSLIRISPATGNVLSSDDERVRNVRLLAVALGLSAIREQAVAVNN